MNNDKHLLKLALKSLPYVKKKAQEEFNYFIRDRDIQNIDACISCPSGAIQHAGHYFSIGAHPGLRFDEDNVHGQCIRCNNFLHGNLANYKENLIKKIGIEKFNALDARKNKLVKRTKLDYIEKFLEYKDKRGGNNE